MAGHQWWVVYPASEGIVGDPANQKIVETTLGDAPSRAWASNGSYQGWQVYMGPFNSLAEAKSAHPGAISVGTWIGAAMAGLLKGIGNEPDTGTAVGTGMAVGTGVDSTLSGLSAIGDFFSRLTKPHTWLRVAEVLVGGAFLIIGLNALLHNPAGKIAKVVR